MESINFLSHTNLAALALILIPLLFLLKTVLTALTSPLRNIPGPFLARFTRAYYLVKLRQGDFHHVNIDLHKTYGPVVRYAPNHYSLADPQALKAIYTLGASFNKSPWYSTWAPPGSTSMFAEENDKVHGQLRRKYQAYYTMSSMVTYEAYIDQCTATFCKRLEEIADAKRVADLAWWLQCFAADTIGTITFSKPLGFLAAGEDVGGFTKGLHANLAYAAMMGVYNELHHTVYNGMAWLQKTGLTGGTPRAYLETFARDAMSRRTQSRVSDKPGADVDETSPKDFLEKFSEAHDRDAESFTAGHVFQGLMTNVVAGSDTTSSSLTATMYYLLTTPRVLRKLREEVAAAELSSPITFKEAQAMPYLQAVVQEALRMHPAVGLPLERVVPPGGAEICGQHFPAGSVVGANAWVCKYTLQSHSSLRSEKFPANYSAFRQLDHYNTKIFGPDAAEFRPERWIEADKERLSYLNKNWFPFGLGSRTCIGKNISMLEMTKLVPQLVRDFDFDLVDDGRELTWNNRWFVIPKNLKIRVRRR